jgi:uncharacterized protein DUF1203
MLADMTFRITGLAPEPFRPLFALDDAELTARGIERCVADAKPGFPCRVSLVDAEPGERVLLLNYTHQPAATPYRASHAIFVREAATAAYDAVDEVPPVLRVRPLSLRAFDRSGMMVDADLVQGGEIEALIARLLANPAADYVQAHYAKRGCYAARIDRA